MSGDRQSNLPQISGCHYTAWMFRDETNGIQLGVCMCGACVCECSPLCAYLSFSQGTESELIESISGASQQGMRWR